MLSWCTLAMVSSRAQVNMDNSFCADICVAAGTLESPGFQVEEGCQKHFDHGDIRMRILCRLVIRIKCKRSLRVSRASPSKQGWRDLCPRVSGQRTRSFCNQSPRQCIFTAM